MWNGVCDQALKRMLDILSVVTERVVNEEDSLRATKSSSLGKRKLDEQDSQNPNDITSSSSSYPVAYKRCLVVSNVPVREIDSVWERERLVRRVAFRREAPTLERPAVTPEWLVNLMRKENGFDEKMIFEKELTATDLKQKQNRLLIPLSQIVEKDFLNEEEKMIIMQHHLKELDKGVDVVFVGSNGQKCELNLRRWDMKISSNYVLVSGWFKATRKNKLRQGQTIRLWSFHSPQGLFFALVPPSPAPAMAPAQVLDPVPIRVVAPEAMAASPVTAPVLDPVPIRVVVPVMAPDSSEEICTYKDWLEGEEVRKRIFVNFPKRKRSTLVPVSPKKYSSSGFSNSTLEKECCCLNFLE